jgi:hypothetical protein
MTEKDVEELWDPDATYNSSVKLLKMYFNTELLHSGFNSINSDNAEAYFELGNGMMLRFTRYKDVKEFILDKILQDKLNLLL